MSELELKFEVAPDDLRRLARMGPLSGAAEVQRLTSRYYDTPDADLRAAGVSLRVRRRGGGYVQTLKRSRAGDLFDRDEWEVAAPQGRLDPALFDATPAAPILAAHAGRLAAVFTVRMQRSVRLQAQNDSVIEISVDRGEILAGSEKAPIREIELELKQGDPRDLYALARRVVEVAPVRLSFEAKSERGYRLAHGDVDEARKGEPAALTPQATVETAFALVARTCLAQLSANAGLLARARRPEALHQSRIALRRLRSALTVFRPILVDAEFPAVRAELKWLSGELDLARDLDVFLARLEADAGGAGRYAARVKDARDGAYDRALAALASPRFASLLLTTALWVQDGQWRRDPDRVGARQEPVPLFAARVLEDRRRRVRRAGRGLHKLSAAVRHDLRIEAKKLRYAAEFLECAFPEGGKRRRRFIGKVKALQNVLGELNDIDTAKSSARHGVRGRGVVDLAFTAGEVVGRMEAGEAQLTEAAVEAFKAFKAAKPFW